MKEERRRGDGERFSQKMSTIMSSSDPECKLHAPYCIHAFKSVSNHGGWQEKSWYCRSRGCQITPEPFPADLFHDQVWGSAN